MNLSDALAILSSKTTPEEILDLARQIDVTPPIGAITIFYSGNFGNIGAYRIAEKISSSSNSSED